MILFPATDIIGGKAVRLVRGDYARMTVYGDPLAFARRFHDAGAAWLHAVDLEGARDGGTPNFETVKQLAAESGLAVEIGGGVRDMRTVEAYLSAGVKRVILGTAAVTNPAFLREAVRTHGEKIAVGADIRDGRLSIKGWLEDADETVEDFFSRMQDEGVQTVICTDISKDGLLGGTNLALYRRLAAQYGVNITASGGVSSLSDVTALRDMGLYGAILGKALYTGDLDLKQALAAAR